MRGGEALPREVRSQVEPGNEMEEMVKEMDAGEQQLFLDCLLKAVKGAACFTLLITLRADFYGYAMSYRPFADALQGACHNLGPMKREELSDAIVLPASS